MRKNHKGFTLAELLIVVAIIGVLVAISIPIFTAQKKKAILAVNRDYIRSAKSVAAADFMTYPEKYATYDFTEYVYDAGSGRLVDGSNNPVGSEPAGMTANASLTGYFIPTREWVPWLGSNFSVAWINACEKSFNLNSYVKYFMDSRFYVHDNYHSPDHYKEGIKTVEPYGNGLYRYIFVFISPIGDILTYPYYNEETKSISIDRLGNGN